LLVEVKSETNMNGEILYQPEIYIEFNTIQVCQGVRYS
jgi:hypothetical protein